MGAVKVSISIEERDLAWLKKAARKQKSTVSGLVGSAVERMRREAALDRVIAYLGDAAELTAKDIKRIEAEWKG